jgi:hypothetical protein
VVDDDLKLKVMTGGGRGLTCNLANKQMLKNRVIFEKITVAHLVNKCLVTYASRTFITKCNRAHHWSLS